MKRFIAVMRLGAVLLLSIMLGQCKGSGGGQNWLPFLFFLNSSSAVIIEQSGGSTSVIEGGAGDSYSVVLASQPADTVTVSVSFDVDQLRVNGSGTSSVVLAFTPSDWNSPQTVTVAAYNDSVPEDQPHASTITHAAASTDPDFNGVAIDSVSVAIADNDSPGVSITQSAGSTSVTEGGSGDSYNVVLTTLPADTVTITVSFDTNQLRVNGSETSPVTLTFTTSDWNSPQTVTVSAYNDSIAEDQPHGSVITHSVASTDPDYDGMMVGIVNVAITDNDGPGVIVTQTGGSTSVTEGGASDSYTVVLATQPADTVAITVSFDTNQLRVNGSSTSPVTLTFNDSNWNSPQTVTATAYDDTVAEGSHNSDITHSASSSDPDYHGISIDSVTVAITDNDTAGVGITQTSGSTAVTEGTVNDTYDVVLMTQPAATVTVTIYFSTIQLRLNGNPSPVTLTFTTTNWDTPQTVTVSAVDDKIAEGLLDSDITHSASSSDPQYNGISIESVTVAITDDDTAGVGITQTSGSTAVSEDGVSDTYDVVLTSQPAQPVTVRIMFNAAQLRINGSDTSPVELTFTASDWDDAQTVTVSAYDDSLAEGAHASVISHASVSSDPDYNDIGILPVPAAIMDNDTAGVVITESSGTTEVSESGSTEDSYDVVLTSQPTDTVTISVSFDTAQLRVNGSETSPVTLTFTTSNWEDAQTMTVSAYDDYIDEEDTHTSVISHSASSTDTNYDGFSIDSVTASITDDDTAGVVITETSGSTEVTEGGPGDSYQIVLTSQPTVGVTVRVIFNQTETDLRVNGYPPPPVLLLYFGPGNWNAEQTLNVMAIDDLLVEGMEYRPIQHEAISDDDNYDGISIDPVSVQINDND